MSSLRDSISRCSAPTRTASRRSSSTPSERCTLFCDEWEQASAGGELANGVEAGVISRGDVIQIGDVLAGDSTWTRSDGEITLFDSTGLAIQDLAICREIYERWREGQVDASVVSL